MSEHRWGVAIVAVLDDDQASALDGLDMGDRVERLPELTSSVEAVRGPTCTECRVDWRTVYAQPDKPWPCPGKRPTAIGGPLLPEERQPSRQERRRLRRDAVDMQAERLKSLPAGNIDEHLRRVRSGAESAKQAVAMADQRRRMAQQALVTDPAEVKLSAPMLCPPEKVRMA